jgi:hypothetical protein
MRFELTTPTLARLCSTPELRPRSVCRQAAARLVLWRKLRCISSGLYGACTIDARPAGADAPLPSYIAAGTARLHAPGACAAVPASLRLRPLAQRFASGTVHGLHSRGTSQPFGRARHRNADGRASAAVYGRAIASAARRDSGRAYQNLFLKCKRDSSGS